MAPRHNGESFRHVSLAGHRGGGHGNECNGAKPRRVGRFKVSHAIPPFFFGDFSPHRQRGHYLRIVQGSVHKVRTQILGLFGPPVILQELAADVEGENQTTSLISSAFP